MRPIKPQTSILNIPRELWDKAASQKSPFLQYDFLLALEKSQSIGAGSGWLPLYFVDEAENAIFYSFVKSHSYGEYIFDWQWANAYKQYGMEYYPKLTSMIPFTPITTSHFLMPAFNAAAVDHLLKSYHELYQHQNFSSSHFLFLNQDEIPLFEQQGYLIRHSMQYHFFNQNYQSFDDYLLHMKGRKAKQVRKERIFPDLKIQKFSGNDLRPEHALQMYQFYLSTIDQKNAIDYLKQDFFMMVFETMKNNVMYVQASDAKGPMAGSLFFFDNERLYGRYWGCHAEIENLHFELCYYQGIDFCIDQKLKVFEAGAQGEHKISRGFTPTITYSAHKLKHQQFHSAIANFIAEEKVQLEAARSELALQLPFKVLPL
ncbi:MAG: N-acetyltransferase [Bdellovibrionales bacterium]|nr:N-acetyltransferase [Bdellovibrionales bacterium]